MQEYAKHIAWCMLLFEENLQQKTSIYILKKCRDSGQCFKESLQGGNVVTNLEIVWMNNKNYWIQLSYVVKNYTDLRQSLLFLFFKSYSASFNNTIIIN